MKILKKYPEIPSGKLKDHLAMDKNSRGYRVAYYTIRPAYYEGETDGYDANNSQHFDNEADALNCFEKRKEATDGGLACCN